MFFWILKKKRKK